MLRGRGEREKQIPVQYNSEDGRVKEGGGTKGEKKRQVLTAEGKRESRVECGALIA